MRLDWETRGVLADFRRCQIAAQNTDLVFHCTNGHVSAHQMIFAGISPLFTDLMQRYLVGHELFPMDLNISLPEIRREHMEMVVEMVYTGQVRITKRGYQPFREICQLLDLCVPIADYDTFFMNQVDETDNDSVQSVQHSQVQLPEVSIPINLDVKSWSSPRVFVCGDCYAVFPLKIDLARHKKSRHDQTTESQASDPPASPIVLEPSTEPLLNTRPSEECSSNIGPSNDKRKIECPDCQDTFRPRDVRQHLAFHLRDQLNECVKKTESGYTCLKCYLCSYESTLSAEMRSHLARGHNMIKKFANEAQLKFLGDAKKLIVEERLLTNQMVGSKKIKVHEEEYRALDPPASPITSETSTEPQLNAQPSRQRPKNKERNLVAPSNDEREVKCPDCHDLLSPRHVRGHLATHLRDKLNDIATKNQSGSGYFKCELCSYETSLCAQMRTHLARSHNMITKFANEAQMKFLDDAKKSIAEAKLSSAKRKRSSRNKKRIHNPMIRKQTLENEDFPEMEDSDIETDIENTLEDESHALNEPPDELDPPMLTGGKKRAVASIKNKSINKISRPVKCPDCLKFVHVRRVRQHLVSHLRTPLKKLLRRSESVPAFFKCQDCPFETRFLFMMCYHIGWVHNMVMKYANAAQKKFMADAQKLLDPAKRKNFVFCAKTRNPNQDNEGSPEMEENDVEKGSGGCHRD